MGLKLKLSTPENVSGAQRTLIDITSALIRELGISHVTEQGITSGTIHDIRGIAEKPHSFSAKIDLHPISKELDKIDPESLIIDGGKIRFLEDLQVLGLDDTQIKILINNAEVYDRLNHTQRKFRKERPKIMNSLEDAFMVAIDHRYGESGNIFKILSTLPQAASFILADALGNREGPYGNPLGTTLVGKECERYHPAIAGTEEGTILVPFIKINKPLKVSGIKTESQGLAGSLLRRGYMPMHPYNFSHFADKANILDVQFVPCYVLMSKRSMIPVGETFQIKMSLAINITTRKRTVYFPETANAINNAKVLRKLASINKLPSNLWVITDDGSGQIEGDDNTTFVSRNQFEKVVSNHGESLPKTVFPITAASLMSENMLSPKPLIVDFAEAGVNPMLLTKDIIKKVITTALDLRDLGLIPEMHPQNHIYLIDKNTGRLSGLIIRDNEGMKIFAERLKERFNIDYDGVFQPNIYASSLVKNGDIFRDLFNMYFDRFMINGTITPLILALEKHFGINIEELINFTKAVYIDWWKSHNKTFDDYQNAVSSDFYYHNRGLICLRATGTTTGYSLLTKQSSHPLIPSYEEMKVMLSS